jgi:DNA-binding NarL/FixJ family response regulator
MEMTPHLPVLASTRAQIAELMIDCTSVVCFGNRALLSLFLTAAPHPQSISGAATTEDEGVTLVKQRRPSVLFATKQLEAGDGLELVRRSHALVPGLRTLLLLPESSPEQMRLALTLGCNGVVIESELERGAMVEAIRAVLGGGIYVNGKAVDALRATARGEGPAPLEPLSTRELEVLQLVVRGYTNREIAYGLVLSPETVKTHLSNILGKLQARDRTHAAVIGIRQGLISWD